jgi:hypothetical protein
MKDLAQLERDLGKFERLLKSQVTPRSNERIAKKVVILAKHYSTGTFSLAQLAQMGHPYGKGFGRFIASSGSSFGAVKFRGAIPYGNPAIINRQSGSFYHSWVVKRMPGLNGTPAIMVINVAPYASFLEHGTYKMIRRPLDLALDQYVQQIGPGIFEEEFSKVWDDCFNRN